MTLEMWILAALLLVPTVVISFVALRHAWEPPEPVNECPPPPGAELATGPSSELVFEYLTYPFAVLIPTTKGMREVLCQDLRLSGILPQQCPHRLFGPAKRAGAVVPGRDRCAGADSRSPGHPGHRAGRHRVGHHCL